MTNVLLKKIERLILVLFCVLSVSFVSCSDSDDDAGSLSHDDFIEITFKGKSYKANVPNHLYATMGADAEGIDITYSTVDCFAKKGFSCFYGLAHFDNYQDLSKARKGNYSTPVDIDDAKHFDFYIDYDTDEAYYQSGHGTNKITAVIPDADNDAVIVEGEFNTTMTDSDTDDSFKMKGKYRMTIFCY